MKTHRALVMIIGLLAILCAGWACRAEAASWSFVDGGSLSSNNTVFPQYPATTVHNGELYVAWYESLSSPPGIRIKKYNGTSWSDAGSGGATLVEGSTIYQVQPSLASYNGSLYVAYVDYESSVWLNPRIQIKRYDGSSWSSYNNNDYNIVLSSNCPTEHPHCNDYPGTNINHMFNANATSPTLLAANGKLYASWMEYPNSIGHYNIRVAELDTGVSPDWHMIDGNNNTGLNYDVNKDAAQGNPIQMSWFNNKLYVGWNEANDRTELRVKEYNPSEGTWTFVDGGAATGLNYDPPSPIDPINRDAVDPHLSSFNGELYAIWSEITYNDPTWGATSELRYKKFNGTAWSSDGSSDGRSMLNYDITNAPYYPTTAVHNNLLYTAWSEAAEVPAGSGNYVMQLRVASFDGTSRTMIDGNIFTGLNGTTTNSVYQPRLATLNGDLYAVWRESTDYPDYQNWIRVRKLPLPPYVSSVSVPSGATYKIGSDLDFTVNFNKAVTVADGTPSLPVTLDTGGTVQAAYRSGSGTTALLFRYTVASGVADSNGITVGTALNANGATLRDTDADNADLILNAIPSTAAVMVDGIAPTAVISYDPAGPYKAGDSVAITATFSEAMAVSPVPQIAISGANTLAATNMTRSSATVYSYAHTVSAGSGSATVALSAGTDLAGNSVTAVPVSGATFTVIPAPAVTTTAATGITASGATLNGTINANGYSTAVTFDYGLTASYTSIGVIADQSPVTGSVATVVSKTISGLECNTLYHFRVNGASSGGTIYGSDLTFTTAPCSATLSVTISGSGSVTSNNGSGTNYTCDSGTCDPVTFGFGDSVTLTATGSNSSFSGWSGDISGTGNPYTGLLMNGDKSVTASFSANPALVQISGSGTIYYTLISALSDCGGDAVILARDTAFSGGLTVSGHTITLRGGFPDASFSGDRNNYTTINGPLAITGGKLIAERVKVMSQ